MRLTLAILSLAAAFCFALGITLPLVEVSRLYFLTDRPSLIDVVTGLWTEDERLLAAVIALFSLLLPAVKLVAMQMAALGADMPRIARWLKLVARWSMLDVLLVALVIFAARTSGFATAVGLPGLWFFAASVVLTAAASAVAAREGRDMAKGPPG
jgi:paraquat-inducible protein A